MKKILYVAITTLLLCSCGNNSEWTIQNFKASEEVEIKNVILMISDGTSRGTIDIARDIKGSKLAIDEFMNGKVITASKTTLEYESKDPDLKPTDSAAAATAMATGFKTTNKMIGQVDGVNVPSVAHIAKTKKNMKIGLVTTVSLLDATPSAFYAHAEERSEYDEIYNAILETDYEVLIGELNINSYLYYQKNDFLTRGYAVAETLEEFNSILPTTEKFVGQFKERYHLSQIERNFPKITDYATKSLEILDNNNDNGFFLMLEGGAVDHANHNHDATNAISDFLAFDDACKIVLDYAKARTDTAVIITSDHGNGDMVYNKNYKKYDANGSYTLFEYLDSNTSFKVDGHTNEDVYLASYIPEGITRIAGKNQKIQNTTIAKYIDALLELEMFEE